MEPTKDHERPGTFADESSSIQWGDAALPPPLPPPPFLPPLLPPLPLRACAKRPRFDVAGGSTSDDDASDDDDDVRTLTLESSTESPTKRRRSTPASTQYAPEVGDTVELRRAVSVVLDPDTCYRGTVTHVRRGRYTVRIGQHCVLRHVGADELRPASVACDATCPPLRSGTHVEALWRAPAADGAYEAWLPAVVAAAATTSGSADDDNDSVLIVGEQSARGRRVRVRWTAARGTDKWALAEVRCVHDQ